MCGGYQNAGGFDLLVFDRGRQSAASLNSRIVRRARRAHRACSSRLLFGASPAADLRSGVYVLAWSDIRGAFCHFLIAV